MAALFVFFSILSYPFQNQGLPLLLTIPIGPLAHLGMVVVNLSGVETLDGYMIITNANRVAAAGYLISWLIGIGLSYACVKNLKARILLIFFWFISGLINFADASIGSV